MNVAEGLARLRALAGELGPVLGGLAARHRFWLESGGITLLALAVLTAFGVVAMRRASAWEDQVRALRAVQSSMLTATSGFVAADSAEAGYWQESASALSTLALGASDPLTVAGIVAQRSEEAGVGALSVRLDQEAGATALGPLTAGEWTAEPQPTIIVADFPGGPATLAQFIGVLPPHVEVQSVSVDASSGIHRNEVRLVVRSIRGPG